MKFLLYLILVFGYVTWNCFAEGPLTSNLKKDTACFGHGDRDRDFLNLQCQTGEQIAVYTVEHAGKLTNASCPAVLTANETGLKHCCIMESTDCVFRVLHSVTWNYFEQCSGLKQCSVRAGRERPPPSQSCDATFHMEFSNYMIVNYYCIPETSIFNIESTAPNESSSFHLSHSSYPRNMTSHNGFQCYVSADCGATIRVIAVDLQLDCSQWLKITDGSSEFNISCSDINNYYIKSIYESSTHFLGVSVPRDFNGLFWFYIEGSSRNSSLTVTCGQQDMQYTGDLCTSDAHQSVSLFPSPHFQTGSAFGIDTSDSTTESVFISSELYMVPTVSDSDSLDSEYASHGTFDSYTTERVDVLSQGVETIDVFPQSKGALSEGVESSNIISQLIEPSDVFFQGSLSSGMFLQATDSSNVFADFSTPSNFSPASSDTFPDSNDSRDISYQGTDYIFSSETDVHPLATVVDYITNELHTQYDGSVSKENSPASQGTAVGVKSDHSKTQTLETSFTLECTYGKDPFSIDSQSALHEITPGLSASTETENNPSWAVSTRILKTVTSSTSLLSPRSNTSNLTPTNTAEDTRDSTAFSLETAMNKGQSSIFRGETSVTSTPRMGMGDTVTKTIFNWSSKVLLSRAQSTSSQSTTASAPLSDENTVPAIVGGTVGVLFVVLATAIIILAIKGKRCTNKVSDVKAEEGGKHEKEDQEPNAHPDKVDALLSPPFDFPQIPPLLAIPKTVVSAVQHPSRLPPLPCNKITVVADVPGPSQTNIDMMEQCSSPDKHYLPPIEDVPKQTFSMNFSPNATNGAVGDFDMMSLPRFSSQLKLPIRQIDEMKEVNERDDGRKKKKRKKKHTGSKEEEQHTDGPNVGNESSMKDETGQEYSKKKKKRKNKHKINKEEDLEIQHGGVDFNVDVNENVDQETTKRKKKHKKHKRERRKEEEEDVDI